MKKGDSYGIVGDKHRALAKLRFAYTPGYFMRVHADELKDFTKAGLVSVVRDLVQRVNMVLLSRRKALDELYFYIRRYEWCLKKIQQLETKRGFKPRYDYVHLMKSVKGADLKLRDELGKELSKQQYKK